MEMTEQEKKIKKLLHSLKHTEEHFEELIQSIESCGLNPEPYNELYEKLKNENSKLKEKLNE
jgi:ribonuclease HIII